MTFPQNASAILIVIAAVTSASLVTAEAESSKKLLLTKEEIRKIIRHGPWPPPLKRDPSNRVSGNRAAIELGRAFFIDSRFSKSGKLSCASCHNPKLGWTDGLPRAVAAAGKLDRNTQSLIDVRFSRWFGWDGQADSLWAQSIRPIIAPKEMNAAPSHVLKVLRSDKKLSKKYLEVFGLPPSDVESERTLVNFGKALAAFQETLVSYRAPFDAFRDALARKNWSEAVRYPIAAQRGVRIFVGRGRCNVCHFGPRFTSGEFHDAGVPYFIGPSKVDPGRHKGISLVKRSPWNLAGKYNDDKTKSGAWAAQQVVQLHRNFGEFKIPTLRGLTHTAPYMHNGSLPTLERVVQHYSEIDIERLHADGERILRPLNLAPEEIADLVSFLKSLSPLKP